VNKIRQYFSYEHFYVIYTTFYQNSTYEYKDELYIPKEVFCTYAYNLGMRTVNRIFDEIPRKFVSEEKYMMSYEDFIYYMISEEDKTSPTSIKYWFKVIDLNNEGVITKKEMEYFYEEQIEKLKNNKKEVMDFKDVLNKIINLIPPKKENKWDLQNFLDNPQNSSIVFNMLLNMNKINNKGKDPFIINKIENGKDYTDWDIFAYKEFNRKMNEDNEDNENNEFNEEEEEEEE
jgi:serine/threonine-protein phosphatase 2A regulatory subunit B''